MPCQLEGHLGISCTGFGGRWQDFAQRNLTRRRVAIVSVDIKRPSPVKREGELLVRPPQVLVLVRFGMGWSKMATILAPVIVYGGWHDFAEKCPHGPSQAECVGVTR